MKKSPILRFMFLYKYLIFRNKIIPEHPALIQKWSGTIKKIPMLTEKSAPLFCQFFGFGSNQKNIYLLLELLYFRFFLVYSKNAPELNTLLYIPWINIIESGRLSSTFTKDLLKFSHKYLI